MKRSLLPLIGFFLPGVTVAILAALMFGGTKPQPVNPFAEFAAYMPGQPLPDLRGCDVWDSYPREAIYAWCPQASGAFNQIGLRGSWDTVEGAYFYPREAMLAGDLVGWLGGYEKARGRRGQWVFQWVRCTAYSRGNIRFMSKVFLIAFR